MRLEPSPTPRPPNAPNAALFRLTLQGGRQDRVNFSIPLRIDRRTEWQQMLNETWRVLKYRYYEPTLNGFNWDAIKDKYMPLLSSIGTNEDFYELGRAMVGELASSHMGMNGPPTYTIDPVYSTRFLGFELSGAGGVYRITHIYRDGPADKEWVKLSVGDVVLEIDGQKLASPNSYWKILSSATTEYLPVKVAKTPSGDDSRIVRIASVTDITDLKYKDYVTRNRERVETRTNGRVAYAHIRQMDQPSLDQFRTDISRDWNKEGIIVDVRYNNGGNIDEPILDILERRPYMFTNPRTGARTWGRRPMQAIAGPKVMLINERSFSDAEATPMGFRTLGLGKLVGTPTSGGVIWTNNYPLLNGANLRVPNSRAVVYDPAKPDNYGTNLENYGVPPDVWVKNSIDDERKGIDRELDAAIDEVMRGLPARGSQNGSR
jgi:tricorn protease